MSAKFASAEPFKQIGEVVGGVHVNGGVGGRVGERTGAGVGEEVGEPVVGEEVVGERVGRVVGREVGAREPPPGKQFARNWDWVMVPVHEG